MSAHSFAVVINCVLFVEVAPLVIGQFSRLYSALNIACFNSVCNFIAVLKQDKFHDGGSDLGHGLSVLGRNVAFC